MHKSRLAGFIIDCETTDLQAAAKFWSAALGMPPVAASTDDPGRYVELVTRAQEQHIEVQRVDHPSRVHLDIETDDLEAEVKRLEALGAKRIGNVQRWVVMEAPTGQRFCVVRGASAGADFKATANTWE
jgi:catechol 2,3-dioxygenase-like lactoylglutathione lyase family enzyme